MKKIFTICILATVLLAGAVVAESLNTTTVEGDIEEFVKEVAEQKGVEEEDITNVAKVDFEALPEEVNLQNIDETNLAIYELDVENEERPVYIITASEEFFEETVEIYGRRMLLNFGFSGASTTTTHLKTATGVITSLNKGYVMTRDGTISGLSTNLEITGRATNDEIRIILYKNGEAAGFKNAFNQDEEGVYSDYDTITPGTLNFNQGDVIAMQVIIPAGTTIKDITTLMEIETN